MLWKGRNRSGEEENKQINVVDKNIELINNLNNNFSEIKSLKSLSKIVSLPNILIISFNRGIEGKILYFHMFYLMKN